MQFTVRTLLIAMTVVAVAAALLAYSRLSAFGVLMIALTVAVLYLPAICLGALALYCRGHRQTFWLGAFFGSVMQFILGDDLLRPFFSLNTLRGLLTFTAVQGVIFLACGAAALATRRLVEKRCWDIPK